MRKAILGSAVLLPLGLSAAPAPGQELKTEEQKTLYALGLVIARNLGVFSLTPADLDVVKAGIGDGVLHKDPKVDLQAYGPKIQGLPTARPPAGAAGGEKAAAG